MPSCRSNGMKGKVKRKIISVFKCSGRSDDKNRQIVETYPLRFVQAEQARSWYVGAYQSESANS